MDEWISVEDRLPEIGVFVDAWLKPGYRVCDVSRNDVGSEGWMWGAGEDGECEDLYDLAGDGYALVTHWQPLPAPPKGATEP